MKKLSFLFLSLIFIVSSIGITGCDTYSDITESDIYFPVLEEAEAYYPSNSSYGKLTFDGKYLLLRSSFLVFSVERLLIWPNGYSVKVENGKIHVLDKNGEVVARVGDRIKVGGGETPITNVEKLIGYSLPDDWEGTCWLVSEIVND
jgi:hypothetical protein